MHGMDGRQPGDRDADAQRIAAEASAAARPVPVTVVGGWLGAGKTTLLNHLLRCQSSEGEGRRLGVIVNDFGAINVDADLIVGVAGDMVQLGNGCVCCTIQGDLVEALERLLDGPEPPDHVIIETSGVSDPRRVAATLEQWARRDLAAIDAVVVVVDVEQHLQLGRRERIVAGGQIAAADILVLNKVDLVDEPTLDALEAKLRHKSRGRRVLRAERGRVAPALVLGVAAFDPARPCALDSIDVHVHETGEPHAHEHHAHASHAHAHPLAAADHGAEFWTWSFRSERPLSARRLRRAVDELPPQVVRAKGTVHLAAYPEQRAVMHVVGRRAELCLDVPWGDQAPSTGLVLIGAGEPLPPQHLEQLFRACEIEPGQGRAGRGVKEWMRWMRRVLPRKAG
jgi:G3E family GTPase